MRKEITPDERILMIEDMIERGEVYGGYRANKYPSNLQKSQKTHAHYKPRTVVDCSKEKFMSVYSPQKSWESAGRLASDWPLSLALMQVQKNELIKCLIHKSSRP